MDADLSHARQLIFSEVSESEKVELRKKWRTGPLVAGTTRFGMEQISDSEEKRVNNDWLDLQIDEKRDEIRKVAKEASDKEVERQREAMRATNKSLRLTLGEAWLKNVPTKIEEGVATFSHNGVPQRLSMDADSKGYLLNGVKLAECPGGIAERIVLTLAKQD